MNDGTGRKEVTAQGGCGLRIRSRKAAARSFTLIELLVVVCVIAILVALLMPATKAMFRKADQMDCFSHASMIGKASMNYASRYAMTLDHVRRYNKYAGVNWGSTFYEDAAYNYGYKMDPDEDSSGLSYATIEELFHCPLDTTGGTRSFSLHWDPAWGKGWRANLTIPMGRRGNINQDDTAYGPYNRWNMRNSISGVRIGMYRNPATVVLFGERWSYGNNVGGYSHGQFQWYNQGEFGTAALQKPSVVFVDGHAEQVLLSDALALDYNCDRMPDDPAW